MPPSHLLEHLRLRPFEPFRIYLTDGTVYEIHHPEMVMPGIASAIIGLPANPAEPFYGRTERVALRHVVRIVPIHQQSSVGDNGPPSQA